MIAGVPSQAITGFPGSALNLELMEPKVLPILP